MTTKPRTKKPAAKPQRKPRKPVKLTDHITPEAIGRSIAGAIIDSLGRRLDDLLSKPDNGRTLYFAEASGGLDDLIAGSQPGWKAEKLGDGVTGYRANYATDTRPERVSPVEEALQRLRDEISMEELSTDMSTERLDSILGPTTPTAGGTDAAAPIRMSGELASLLNGLADRLSRDNARRTHLLNRLEL